MRRHRPVRTRILLGACALTALLAACGTGDTGQATAPGTPSMPDDAPDPPAASPRAETGAMVVRFTSGTRYATIGDRAEVDLSVVEQRVETVLEEIAAASSVRLEIAPDTDLTRKVTLNFKRVPLRTVFALLGQESGTVISADAEAILVRSEATATP